MAIAECIAKPSQMRQDRYAFLCAMEARVPFVVGERGLGGKYHYFIAKKDRIVKRTRYRNGLIFSEDGGAFATSAAARSAATRLAGNQRCDLDDLTFDAKGPSQFVLACRFSD